MITEDLGGKEYQPTAETCISFCFSLLFSNKPKIVTNRDHIWSPPRFAFSVHLDTLKQTMYLRTKLLSQRNFMIHPCMILYQSRENVYGRVNQAICVYTCTAMHVCELSLQDKKLLWRFKKMLRYQGDWIAAVFWTVVLFPDSVQK